MRGIKSLLFERFFDIYNMLHFIEEPRVDLRECMDVFGSHAGAECFCQRKDAARGRILDLLPEIRNREVIVLLCGKSMRPHIEHADRFLKYFFKIAPDRHHFADTLHFGSDSRRCSFKFGHVPAWHLEHEIIERGLEASGGLACD